MKQLLTTTILTAAFTLLAAMSLTAKQRVSIHDPSVVYDQSTGSYYIVGSHKAGAFSADLQNWSATNPTWQPDDNAAAFATPAVKTVRKGGAEVTLPPFNAADWAGRTDAGYDVNGNMWAPDVIWNTAMRKWCMYLSINGNAWHSSIILLTADAVEGPYTYQAPVITCGFYDEAHSYKETDLELVLGASSSLSSRYDLGNKFGDFWPHTIDPCVFYDADGQLWMTYGSWFGGIWMLQLDELTGLRDYDVSYASDKLAYGMTSDGYFGRKIAGGFSVSGEGSYIQRIGSYYYLFVSYGGFGPNEGYEMRVFRSEKPDGPYVDSQRRSAVYSGRALNFGLNSDTRGEKLMGAYNQWGEMTVGECAQGHNSVVATPDGRHLLVYHTKFNNGTIFHEVRVHQLFVNQDGWLVAAPFEYNGETATDRDIATRQPFTASEITGDYSLLIHRYGLDHKNYEEVTPVSISLSADGTVTGAAVGTWSIVSGTGYFNIVLDGTTYSGVIIDELMDGNSLPLVSFTACASATGVSVWGYKVKAPVEGWTDGMVAHYGFDDDELANTLNDKQVARLLAAGDNTAPVLETTDGRQSQYVRLNFGVYGNESYVDMPNPLSGLPLDDGATISFWVRRLDGNAWDALFGFTRGNARLYMTGNSYVGYNGWDGYWIDLNHPGATTSDNIAVGQWQQVTLTVAPSGLGLYIDGQPKSFATCAGQVGGADIASASGFDYSRIVSFLSSADGFYLGRGSFWGSDPALIDDVIVYSRPLSAGEVQSLYSQSVQGFDFASLKPVPVPGDVDGDGVADGNDLSAVVSTMLSGSYSEAADLNHDSKVDIIDAVQLVDLIGRK